MLNEDGRFYVGIAGTDKVLLESCFDVGCGGVVVWRRESRRDGRRSPSGSQMLCIDWQRRGRREMIRVKQMAEQRRA